MKRTIILGLLPALLIAAYTSLATVTINTPQVRVDFARDIRPILKAQCYQCHGRLRSGAGLRLDIRAAAMKGGLSGPVIIPRNSANSRLLMRLLGKGGLPRMPLGFAPLSPAQITLFRSWIDQGASWPASADRKHWAYICPVRPSLPAVHDSAWVRNPIDRFVLAKLEQNHLHPSPQAPRDILIRRAYLDLIGIPPSVKAVKTYENDRRPGAYARVVDRLLASPHYGERWAIPWLDLARYADTNGYEKDERRSMWPYRDWVINALNADMPFDQFTIKQIAGDMLAHPTLDDRIATGFHRNTMFNAEGGVDRSEQTWYTIIDRVGTTASTWLGTTLACAECHDHKYDPFSQKEFYRFFAFFDHCSEPELEVPTAQETAERAFLQDELRALEPIEARALAQRRSLPATAARILDLKRRLGAIHPPTTLVMQEDKYSGVPTTYVHVKGSYLNKAEEVSAGVPAVLNPFPTGLPLNRLGLAHWLVDPANPLTARVQVNRAWEQFFGEGIVETSDDFGTQGSPPTNQPLLDWLATEFVRRHWSMKAIHRLIVLSATYRQSSVVSPALLRRDPKNELLARGPRFRVPAEIIRDIALKAAGLLSGKIGGPSVFPPQPDGIWVMPYNGDKWVTSTGEDRYRRGLYTFIRRTSPYPQLVAFDATSREYCTVRRIRTNTPLQALTTLNDPAFFEAAQALARRMVKEGGSNLGSEIEFGFRCCVARRPSAAELLRLTELYRQVIASMQDRERASLVAGQGRSQPHPRKLAALTVVANVMLNLDETVTKE
ncbi:MAG TPA: PSD1 and planctomycete cytochrome C domain-containing protein [Chthonomonadales bacterium]|nr:PSD1 and planctomycete cytochrome C domain-containing protein [Chthonomonadales bacterium]